jgi:acetate---CoA ligase (ADP-forming)
MTTRDLSAFFAPTSVAIVGASNDTTTLRGRIPMQMLKGGYEGPIWPVHPRETEIQGLKTYASMKDLPGKLDLALICIPSSGVIEALEQAADAGARAAFVYTAGFAEEGEENRALQVKLTEMARRRGILMAGPNGVGLLSADSRLAATFSPSISWEDFEAARGNTSKPRTAIIAQSGGLAFSISLRGAARGLSFSKIVSTGNEADVDAVDFLEHMIDDPGTQIIILFLESIRRGPEFMRAAQRARAAGKSIIVTKVGRTAAGSRAAASHTASMTGTDAVADAVFRQCGVIRVDDIDELIDVALACAFCPPARGNRVGIVTVSGGVGGWMSDMLGMHGLDVPAFSPTLQGKLREFLPSFAAVFNPVDVTAGAGATDHHVRSLETVAASDEVDAIVVVTALSIEGGLKREEARYRAVAAQSNKPIVFFSYPLPMPGIVPWIAEMGIPVYLSLRGCARAVAALVERGKPAPERPSTTSADATPKSTPPELLEAGQTLTEYESKRLLETYAIPGPAQTLVRTADEAVAASKDLGYPVALKIQSRAIAHKTEMGGVRLGLGDERAVREAFTRVIESARYGAPFASIQGILVQRMAPAGLEALAGVVNDPVFGPIVTVGLGGIHTEIFKDVASAPAPLDEAQALDLLQRLKAWPLFAGARGAQPADAKALARTVAALSRFAWDHRAHIAEIDLNPIFVHVDGKGVSVADALIVTAGKKEA